jgi:protein-disulfide isomerase
MSRKSQRNPKAVDAAAPQPQPADRRRRNLVIAAGAAAVAAVGGGVALFGRGASQADEDLAMAQRPGLASPHAPSLGDATAKVHIVEFLDPACETCAVFYPLIKQVMADNPGKIRLSLRHVPLHKGADYVVALLEASRKQGKYWPTLEALLKGQERWVVRHVVQPQQALEVLNAVGLNWDQLSADMGAPEVVQRMAQDRADATLLDVKQTPEYFVNGRQMDSFGRQQLLDLVDRALRRAYR